MGDNTEYQYTRNLWDSYMLNLRSLNRFILIGLALFGLSVSSVNAMVLTFDDVPGGSIQNSAGPMPTYNGFNFETTLFWIDVEGSPAWNYGAHSGDFVLINNAGGIRSITDSGGADFTFDGLWAKKWATAKESGGADSLFGTLSGYNNGGQVWSIGTGLNGSYEFYGAQLGLIDELQLGFGTNFMVDDISLNVSAVPAPAAVWLFGTGILGLIGFSKRRKAA
jgi:hypothetical protein